MGRNILLTSLYSVANGLPVRYFSIQNQYDNNYCDAILDTEAGIKAMLARHLIHEIIIIGNKDTFDADDNLTPLTIKEGSRLYSEDKEAFSTYEQLLYRLAQFADEKNLDFKQEDALIPVDVQKKVAHFIQDYQENTEDLKNSKFNRLFDALSQNEKIFEEFWEAFFNAFPELSNNSTTTVQWVKSYLYRTLKPSAKLELLPVNENVTIRFISESNLEATVSGDEEDINLYVTLNSDDAADSFILLNLLNIVASRPGNRIKLQKIYNIRDLPGRMSGIIRDDTDGFVVTELFHAIRAFLNYGKADMMVKLWEKSGEKNESLASLLYAMRHVDVGLSMCNIAEIDRGIRTLRKLFKEVKFWQDCKAADPVFLVIADCIKADYGPLLEGDGEVPFLDMVKWAYRHQFYQQTLTLIEANAPKNLVNTGMFYYCNDEVLKEHVTRLFAAQRLQLKPYEYYKMDHIDHYFIKSYNRIGTKGRGSRDSDPQRVYAELRAESIENTNPSFVTGFTVCDSKETLQNLLFSYYNIGDLRNKISHAESDLIPDSRLMVSESDESTALIQMRDGIEYFISNYEKVFAEVKNKNPKVVLITRNEVRAAADQMKRENMDQMKRENMDQMKRENASM